jgi:hypothetical protein
VIIRFVSSVVGVHVRTAVFTAAQPAGVSVFAHLPHAAFEKVGELTMRPDEWDHFRQLITRGPGDLELPPDGTINVEIEVE